MPYHQIKLNITPKQQKTAIKGGSIRLAQEAIGTGQLCMIHPVNYKKLVNAKGGVNLSLSPGEIMATSNYHGLAGSGLLDDIWGGIKSAGKWLMDAPPEEAQIYQDEELQKIIDSIFLTMENKFQQ
jgi:hypothetical protein